MCACVHMARYALAPTLIHVHVFNLLFNYFIYYLMMRQ